MIFSAAEYHRNDIYMINKDKVRLMTAIAVYKSRNEEIFNINKYFYYDYIIWHLMQSAMRYTVGMLLIFTLIILLDADIIFYNVNLSGIMGALRGYVIIYLAGLMLYMMLSAYIYSKKYKKAQRGMLYFNSMLKRLAKRFNYNE